MSMPSVLLFLRPTATIVFPETLRQASIHLHSKYKIAISIHDSSLDRRSIRRIYASDQPKLMKSASTRCSENFFFNGVAESRLEDDKRASSKITPVLENGFEYTVNRMSKWVFAAILSVVIVWKHDAEVVWVALGTVLNFWFSIALKRMINQERPSVLRSDPGMPSSHAQFLFFAVVYAFLSLMNRTEINGSTAVIGAFTIVCGSYLSWLRVSQGLHTINQVLVGAAIGSLCGMTWFWLWHEFVLEAFIYSNWVQKIVVVSSIIYLKMNNESLTMVSMLFLILWSSPTPFNLPGKNVRLLWWIANNLEELSREQYMDI